jgi:hypothetical protein
MVHMRAFAIRDSCQRKALALHPLHQSQVEEELYPRKSTHKAGNILELPATLLCRYSNVEKYHKSTQPDAEERPFHRPLLFLVEGRSVGSSTCDCYPPSMAAIFTAMEGAHLRRLLDH